MWGLLENEAWWCTVRRYGGKSANLFIIYELCMNYDVGIYART